MEIAREIENKRINKMRREGRDKEKEIEKMRIERSGEKERKRYV